MCETNYQKMSCILSLICFMIASVAAAQSPSVLSLSPARNASNVPVDAAISVTFDMDMDQSSIDNTTFRVNGRLAGLYAGAVSYDGASKTVTFNPDVDFKSGEVILVTLTTGIESTGGVPLARSHTWSFTTVSAAADAGFVTNATYQVSATPNGVYAADLDADADIDLVSMGRDGGLTVLLNDGTGAFAVDHTYPSGFHSEVVTAADFNNDGMLDLANQESGSIRVHMNVGGGAFAPQVSYATGSMPTEICSGDLNGDGAADLVTSSYGTSTLSVLLNSGDGTFASYQSYPAGSKATGVSPADFDSDGDLDLVSGCWWAPSISVSFNDGNGAFDSRTSYSAGGWPRRFVTPDFNGDGHLDIAVSNFSGQSISVYINNGDGTFAPQKTYGMVSPYWVECGDLDGDGDIDLVAPNYGQSNLTALWNDGSGNFGDRTRVRLTTSAYGPYAVCAADFDGDNDLDIAVTTISGSRVEVLFNQPIPDVVSTTPAPDAFNISSRAEISATFDTDMDPATINSSTFAVMGQSAGPYAGTVSYDEATRTATFIPEPPLEPSDLISVSLTPGIKSAPGAPLAECHCWSFTTGPVTADFVGAPTSGCYPLTVNFTDLSVGDVTYWNWDFGDGMPYSEQNPSFIFYRTGKNTVRLWVQGQQYYDEEVKHNYITVYYPPTARFSASQVSGPVPLTVDFTDNSYGEPTSWYWDFGDGDSSYIQNPSHTYTDAGTYTVLLTASNDCGSDNETVTDYITVNAAGNQPPVVADIPDQVIAEGSTFTTIALDDYVSDGNDPDSVIDWQYTGNIDLSVAVDVSRMATVTVPTPDWNGSETILFTATDPGLLSGSDSAAFTVTGINDPPVLAPIGAKSTTENDSLMFDVQATDVETIPALTAEPLPPGATFTDNGNGTGTFNWTPTYTQSGGYSITFFATDDSSLVDSEMVMILVNEAGNQPPELDPIGDKSVTENTTLNFGVAASDPDGSIPALTTSALPTGANFTDNGDGTGTFDWTPTLTQSGTYMVTFFATDTFAYVDSELVTITVIDAGNQPPVLSPIADTSVIPGATLNFGVTAYDPDETIPALTALPLPTGASFIDNGDGSGTFDWMPDSTQVGTHLITFFATDDQAATDSAVVTLTVETQQLEMQQMR